MTRLFITPFPGACSLSPLYDAILAALLRLLLFRLRLPSLVRSLLSAFCSLLLLASVSSLSCRPSSRLGPRLDPGRRRRRSRLRRAHRRRRHGRSRGLRRRLRNRHARTMLRSPGAGRGPRAVAPRRRLWLGGAGADVAELLRGGVARATTRRFTGGREARVTRTRKWPSELKGAFGSSNAIAGTADCTTRPARAPPPPRARSNPRP